MMECFFQNPSLRGLARLEKLRLSGILCVFVFLSVGFVSCKQPVQGPQDTVKAYVLAIKQNDTDRAYSLLSEGLRERCTRRQFKRNLKQARKKNKKELETLLNKPKNIQHTASVDLGSGDKLLLEKEGGVWRVVSEPFSFYGQKTPREALRSFVRALERKRYEVLLKFAPRQWRKQMEVKDIKRLYEGERAKKTRVLVANLKKSLDNRIEISGDKAVMLYGDNQQVRFAKEEGVWKIVGFE